MTLVRLTVLMIAALALSACTNAGRFGNVGGTDPMGTAAGVDPALSDPTSPAFFAAAVGDRVLFEVDSSELTVLARGILDAQADWLAANGDFNIVVEGHADEQGTREYNIALGARRADAVRGYLIDRGVAPGRILTRSFGKERPVEICSDESCFRVNRRAVTVLTAPGLS